MSESFAVRDSAVDSEALARFIEHEWGFGSPVECYFIKRGVKDTYLVRGRQHKAILSLWPRGLRSREEIQDEVTFLELLKAAGANVMTAIADKRGESVRSIQAPEGVRHLVLFAEAEGGFGDFGEGHVRELGRSLALLHLRSNGIRVPTCRPELDIRGLIDRPMEVLKPALEGTPEGDSLHRVASACRDALAGLTQTRPEYGFCHGDYGGFNTFVDQSGTCSHFDFDFCGYGWRAYDMAVFLWSRYWNCEWRTALAQWKAFIEGYSQIRHVSSAELHSIPYFVACREIWLLAHNEAQSYRHPRRPGFGHVKDSVRFLIEWLENPGLAWRVPGAKAEGRSEGQEDDPPHCSCLIGHPQERKILLLEDEGLWRLPGAVTGGSAQRNPTPACKGALAKSGLPEFEVWPMRFARLSDKEIIFECEASDESLPDRKHARWIGEDELTGIRLADPSIIKEVSEWFKDAEAAPAGRAPWEKRGWWREAIGWIGRQLPDDAAFSVDLAEHGKVYSPWNAAFRVSSTEGRFFFKAVRSWNAYEPALTKVLCRLFPQDTPRVIAVDEARGWILMEEFGRHLKETGEDNAVLCGAVRRFAQLQIESVNHLGEIAATGIVDLRACDADEVTELIDRVGKMPMGAQGTRAAVGHHEVLAARRTALRALKHAGDSGVPKALVHGDFSWINIGVKADGRGYVFFDWGESCIWHPFISIAHFAEHCSDCEEVIESYLDAWSAYGSTKALMAAFEAARTLKKLHAIRVHEQVYRSGEGRAAGYAFAEMTEAIRELAAVE